MLRSPNGGQFYRELQVASSLIGVGFVAHVKQRLDAAAPGKERDLGKEALASSPMEPG